MILVRAGDPTRVGLWEVHPDHPGGEVYVCGTDTYSVAPTRLVRHKLNNGDLVIVEGGDPISVDTVPFVDAVVPVDDLPAEIPTDTPADVAETPARRKKADA